MAMAGPHATKKHPGHTGQEKENLAAVRGILRAVGIARLLWLVLILIIRFI